MANQFLNATEYANVMLLLLKNQLVMGKLVDGQFKDQVTDQNGLKINVKRPPRFIAGSGAALQAKDLVVGSENVAVTEYSNVHISIGDIEYVQSYNELMRNETMKSAASTLAHKVDNFIASKTLKFPSWVERSTDPATTNTTHPNALIASPSQAFAVHTRLMNNGVPNSDLMAAVLFDDGEKIRGSLTGGFIQGVNKNALERVKIPVLSEIDWYASQQIPSLTTGSRVSSAAAQDNGGAQNVDYLTVKDNPGMSQTYSMKGLTNTNTAKAGEVFTIAGTFAYDWRNQQTLPYLQQFTILSDVTFTGTTATFTISPAIIVPNTDVAGAGTVQATKDVNSAFATVNSVPANSAAITWVGAASTTYRVRSAWHKRAIALVSARLQMPFTGIASYAVDPETGISIRYWRGSDITTGAHVHRWDMIYGAACMDPFLGARLNGDGTLT